MLTEEKKSTDFRGLSGSVLKVTAIAAMTLDHTAAALFEPGTDIHVWFRLAGRLAFPLFAFLATEGCARTRSFTRYVLTLLAFAIISEIPFDLVIEKRAFAPDHQNTLFTLFCGVMLCGSSRMQGKVKYAMMAFTLVAAHYLEVDYGLWGVGLVFLLYLLHEKDRFTRSVAGALVCVNPVQMLSCALTALYNGRRGFVRGKAKYLFYAYYPLHLAILAILSII